MQNFEITGWDSQRFLSDYWQQQPCVVRNAIVDPYLLEASELAGLALEEDVESRLIQQQQGRWQVEHGPIAESVFASLPEKDWTLLVQGVDLWVPRVNDLLAQFRFLPRWRLDDVMVSYATVGGTVSQHYDFFDVFLIQGEGQRHWQVGQRCTAKSEFLPNEPVRILREFIPQWECTLEPGDMLYIPASFAHYGVSLQNSLTYSVGFRAPSITEILDGVITTAMQGLDDGQRYRDTDHSLRASSGHIPASALAQVREQLLTALDNPAIIGQWFGRYVTERKYPDVDWGLGEQGVTVEDIEQALQAGTPLYRNMASRFAYIKEGAECDLFVDGERYGVSVALAEALSDDDMIDSQRVLHCLAADQACGAINSGKDAEVNNSKDAEVLVRLFAQESLTFVAPEDTVCEP